MNLEVHPWCVPKSSLYMLGFPLCVFGSFCVGFKCFLCEHLVLPWHVLGSSLCTLNFPLRVSIYPWHVLGSSLCTFGFPFCVFGSSCMCGFSIFPLLAFGFSWCIFDFSSCIFGSIYVFLVSCVWDVGFCFVGIWFILGKFLICFCAHLNSPCVFLFFSTCVFSFSLWAFSSSLVNSYFFFVPIGVPFVCFQFLLCGYLIFPLWVFSSLLTCSWVFFMHIQFSLVCFGFSLLNSQLLFVHIWVFLRC